jgi:hypothetical protein
MFDSFRTINRLILSAVIPFFILTTITPVFSDIPSCDVPLDNPVYEYLDLLPLPGRVGGISIANRPFSEAQVCTLLVYAAKEGLQTDTSLTNFYLRRFGGHLPEAPDQKPPASFKFDDYRTYAYPYLVTGFNAQDSNYSTNGFSAVSVDSVEQAAEFYNLTRAGLRLRSSIGSVLAYFDGSIVTEYSTLRTWYKVIDPRLGIFQSPIMNEDGLPGHFMGYDEFTAYVKAELPWFKVKMGSDRVAWGYGDRSGLLFSGAGKPFLHCSLEKTIGSLVYTFLYGKLTGDTFQERRIVYAKHISWAPQEWLSIGLSDAVISVNRDFEPLYCFPFVPYYFTEHFLGDPDNRIMSFEGNAQFRKKFGVYGELFLDDITNLLGMFSNDSWSDKWGMVAGAKITGILPFLSASAVRAEFVQIEPWVYTTSAKVGATANNYPINYGRPIGNQMGPHSRSIKLELSGRYSKTFGGDLSLQQIWKGHGSGSSIFDINGITIDTIGGVLAEVREHETKEYRFASFDRNRTVFSVSLNADCARWLRCVVDGDVVLERRPVSVGLFHAGLSFQINSEHLTSPD